MTSLAQLGIGSAAIVEQMNLPDEVQHHLMHMGFAPDARVLAVRKAPAGDPTVYAIDGFEIALRRETARAILVSVTEEPVAKVAPERRRQGARGLGRLAAAGFGR